MSVWRYDGKRVVVSGGGGGGMGAAATTELANLGAEIHVIDLKEPPVPVASHQVVDLRDPDATAAAIENIGGTLHALFNCAGLPGPPFSDVDTMLVNFAAMRHLAELCADRMTDGGAICSISSGAGMGYLQQIEKWMPLMQTEGFAGAKAWCEANPEAIASGYAPSKEAIILWTHYAAREFMQRDVRVNVISPGPTDTPMMPAFEDHSGKELVDTFTLVAGRRSTPEEQAYPMIFLNSDAASYITGENLNTDGGMFGGIISGQVDLAALFADFFPQEA
jgi:NAD(P)-dependent dehydrogenase (short-subunit alcohol dehydrogenase family)